MYQLKFILSLNEIFAPYKFTVLYITNSQSIIFFGFLCAIVYGHKIFPMTQPSLLGSTNSNFGETHRFILFLRKMKEKKLRRSYQMNMNHYSYPNNYESSICTFSVNRYFFFSIDTFLFNMHIFVQQAYFHTSGNFSVNRYVEIGPK